MKEILKSCVNKSISRKISPEMLKCLLISDYSQLLLEMHHQVKAK